MRLRLVFENGNATIRCTAEGAEEQLMLGCLGERLIATIEQEYQGHPSYNRVKYIAVNLAGAPAPKPEDQCVGFPGVTA